MKGWDMINKIKVLVSKGLKVAAISRHLGIDRKTVRKYRDMDMEGIVRYKRNSRYRTRKTDKFKGVIDDRLEKMLEDGVVNAQAIYEEVKQLGYRGSSRTLRRYVGGRMKRQLKKRRIYEPFETAPGYQALVDLGESRRVWIDGARRVAYFIVMTLGYSRKMYVEWYDRPVDTEMFIRFHEHAFAYFGGVPEEIVYDQTKLVVLEEAYGEAEFNRDFLGFSQDVGFQIFLCRKNDPETKGKVESSVRYVKRGFLPGRRFSDFGDLEGQWFDWLQRVADEKPNETTGEAPVARWEVDRASLKPYGVSIYPVQPACRGHKVYEDGLVKVLGNRYSVPHPYHGLQVKVRVTDVSVEIRDLEGRNLYTHARCFEKGKRIIVREHYRGDPSVETVELEKQVLEIYGDQRFILAIRERFPRHYREQFRQLVRYADRMDRRILRQACQRVLDLDCAGYGAIKRVSVHLYEQAFEKGVEQMDVPATFHIVPDLEFEQRPAGYYDELLGVRP